MANLYRSSVMPQEMETELQERDNETSGQERRGPAQLTEFALRGMSQVYDMNLAAMRVWMQTQARAASVLGWPDWSNLFNSVDGRSRNLFGTGADQWIESAQRASEAAVELQREVGRVVETQAATVAETIQLGLREIGSQAGEGLNQLVQTVREQADQTQRLSEAVSERVRETLEQVGDEQAGDEPSDQGEPQGRNRRSSAGRGRRGRQRSA